MKSMAQEEKALAAARSPHSGEIGPQPGQKAPENGTPTALAQGHSPEVPRDFEKKPASVVSPPLAGSEDDGGDTKTRKGPVKRGKKSNNVRRMRIERMMSKAELSRRANLSVLTIDRVEKGFGCRMDTKRKILEALGLSLADRVRVFGEEE